MGQIILISALILAWSALPGISSDIYVWTDADGVKHFSNQSAAPNAELFLSDAEQTRSDPTDIARDDVQSPDERLDEDIMELERLLEELEQQLRANAQSSPNAPAADRDVQHPAGGDVIDPAPTPFGGFENKPIHGRIRSYRPYGLCYDYGRLYSSYYYGNYYCTLYGGFHRYRHYSQPGRYARHRYHRGYDLKTERISPHRSQRNRFHVRGSRTGSQIRGGSFGIRTGSRIGARR